MAAPRAALLLLALVLAAQPPALCQSATTVTVSGAVPTAPLSPTSSATMGVNLGAVPRRRGRLVLGASAAGAHPCQRR